MENLMTYSIYLFSNLLKFYDDDFKSLTYHLQYEQAYFKYMEFYNSQFNISTKNEYDCIINYLKSIYK
jgi:hypothetical protein